MIKDWTYGQRVSYNGILVRMHRMIAAPDEYKYWEAIQLKAPQTGIFLGLRTLSNGNVVYGIDAVVFQPVEYFRAALISPSKKENPIYVPLNAIGEKACQASEA